MYATAGMDGVCDWKTPPGPAPGSNATYCGIVGSVPQPNNSPKKRAAAAPSAAYISMLQIAPAGGLGLDPTGIGMGGVRRAMAESVSPYMVPEGSLKSASLPTIGTLRAARSTVPPAATTRASIASTSGTAM